MDNIWKWVTIGLGGIVVVSLAILVFNLMNGQEETIKVVDEKSSQFTTQLMESEFTQYDGTTVTGSDVINCIKRMKQEVICITVNNGRQATEYIYSSNLSTDLTGNLTAMLKDAKDKSNLDKYINPAARFEGEVIRDASTDTIIGITFTKK